MYKRMKRWTVHTGYLLFMVAVLLAASPLFAVEFSADTVMTSGKRTLESKFYFAGDKWRMEEQFPQGARITIFRREKKSLILLFPEKKRYIIQPLPEPEFQIIATRKPGEELERIELGQEKVSGLLTTKYRVTYKARGRLMKTVEWYSKDLDVVIKSESGSGRWSQEIRNIKKGKQDQSLFEIPGDYQALSSKDIVKPNKPSKRTNAE
ncbi:MAG TPA: hypothetical protein DCO77_12760 [Nitrospiraceae bacterium]|nr:hypothetical protein [Nitrospiraceae bacterium]